MVIRKLRMKTFFEVKAAKPTGNFIKDRFVVRVAAVRIRDFKSKVKAERHARELKKAGYVVLIRRKKKVV